jgi:hypothetical protein
MSSTRDNYDDNEAKQGPVGIENNVDVSKQLD